jgi:ketosteroid isomerase-like protein
MQQLIAFEKEWVDAEVHHDEAVLSRVLDDRFLVMHSNGRITEGKNAFIAAIRQINATMDVVHEKIEVFGDTAIIVDTFTVYRTGAEDSPPIRCTATLIKRDGKWRAIAEQMTQLPRPAK